ncbi:helix-turn-helix domain-containing protein [Kineococcus rhizosphaerae]|uniref:XRE family transcriptional regulator n=1 Tax=Kineococcus rhizosphaerae TaxID=559628 RepID=A0A2T0R1P2_9ACTN|nr:XRE family transcriptional regulator [Kineococcus rhizosphaerae]
MVSTVDLSTSLAETVLAVRTARGLSVAALAEASGVSRAMIAKIERGAAQPTAVLLGRLAGALGLTLSQLVARAEGDEQSVARRADQPLWTDPATGYVRRAVTPGTGGPLELIEVRLPPGARVGFPAGTYAGTHHQVWVLEGGLRFHEGAVVHDLGAGDCLRLGPPQDCVYENASAQECRYLVCLVRTA